MNEIWKPVPYKPFDTKYFVSNKGRVKPIKKSIYSNSKEEYLRPGVGSRGYGCVTLYCNGQSKQSFIHRMVALVFVGEPPEGKNVVCHLDDNKLNNVSENLCWGDANDNMRHMVDHGRSLYGSRNPRALLTDSKVLEIRRLYATGEYSQTKLSKIYGVNQTTIGRAINSKAWKHL